MTFELLTPHAAETAELETVKRLEVELARIERAAKLGTWRWVMGEDGPHWSPGLYTLQGLDPAKARPHHRALFESIDPRDQLRVAETLREALNTGQNFYLRIRDQASTGVVRHFDTYGEIETKDGKVVAITGVVQDVTDLVGTEEALKASEAQFRILAEEASDAISRNAKDGTCVYQTPRAEQLTGYAPEELIGTKTFDLVAEEDKPAVAQRLAELYQTGVPQVVTYRMRHKAGHWIWVESSVRGIPGRDGRVTEIVSVSRDVTERKRTETELQAARDRAEAASRTKSRFLANMSHELRTPLNAIIGFSDILKQELFGELGNARYKEYAHLIHESGQLLLDLISDILDMSKIEAGKYQLNLESLDFAELVQACLRLVHGRADEGGVKIECQLSAPSLPVTVDKRAVKQVLLNLLSNAVKFTPRDGTVTISATVQDDQLAMCVSDTGIGIAPDDLPRLGQPFEQVNPDSDLTKVGTGLGLALVKSLAQLHGGTMRIESKLGAGTAVTVTMPVADLAAASATDAA